jgi:drug/metabolite transporter (DMT)-like permease
MNPVWTWLIHGESPNRWAVAGGAAIIGATLWNTWMQSRHLNRVSAADCEKIG